MSFDVDALLSHVECVKARKPQELREWVLAKCDAFARIPELRRPVLMHEGPFKWFHEEIYPLSLFAVRRYGNRDDVLCVPKLDPTRDVNAEIREPSRTINIEVTGARDPSEHLRMEYLVEHRHVFLTGGLKATEPRERAVKSRIGWRSWTTRSLAPVISDGSRLPPKGKPVEADMGRATSF